MSILKHLAQATQTGVQLQ